MIETKSKLQTHKTQLMHKAQVLFFILMLFSCKNGESKKPQSENKVLKQKDILVLAESVEKQSLKNCVIDEDYFEEKTKLAKIVSNDEIKSLNLTMIEGIDRDATAQVKIIDTLFAAKESTMVVVSQESENESTAYIVNLNNKNKAFQFEPVFYADVVEYITATSTKITDKKIEIITKTDNGEDETTKETVTLHFVNGKIKK